MDRAEVVRTVALRVASVRQVAITTEEIIALVDATIRWTVWAPGTTYNHGDFVVPSVRNGRRYRALLDRTTNAPMPGMSGTTEPSWPLPRDPYPRTLAGEAWGAWAGSASGFAAYGIRTVADNTIIWEDAGPDGGEQYDLSVALYNAWLLKAAKASDLYTYTNGNQKVQASQVHDHCLAMAQQFAPCLI